MTEIVAEISQLARRSPHVNQRSGVSARLSIANYETLVANAARRALAERRARGRAARLRPRRARRVDVGQDRDRDARRRPRGPGARPHHEGGGARGVPRPCEARAARPDRRRRSKTARSCTPARTSRGRSTAKLLDAARRRCRPCSPTSASASRRPASRRGIEFVLEGLHLTKRLNKDARRRAGRVPRAAELMASRVPLLAAGTGPRSASTSTPTRCSPS